MTNANGNERTVAMELMHRPWVEVDAWRERNDLAIVPTGAVEVYGPHLPTGSDTLVAAHVARLLGEELDALVLPAVPVGWSQSLEGYPGTLSVSTATLQAYVGELLGGLLPWGVRRVLFVNSHRGNVAALSEVALNLQARHGVRCAQVFWWDFAAPLVRDIVETGAHANGHAAEIGTSVLLHIAPELVVRERIVDATPQVSATAYPDVTQYRPMRDRSIDGVVGNPTVASAEKGAEIVRRGVERIVAFVRDELS